MDLEFDSRVVLWTMVFWVVTLLGLWKWGSGWGNVEKVILSVLSLPLYFFVISRMSEG